MEDWKKFYSSAAWKQARESYTKYRRGLCEICLSKGIIKAGEIVQHKRHLTAETVNDPAVELELLYIDDLIDDVANALVQI